MSRALLASLASGAVLALGAAAQDAPRTGEPDAAATADTARTALPATLRAEEARPALDRALAWLVLNQRGDGSLGLAAPESQWEIGFAREAYYGWQVAAQALACRALAAADETPERRAALERAVRWLCETRVPRRGNEWDNDGVWAYLCGLDALVALAADPRFAEGASAERIAARGRELCAALARNQTPSGGWAYYDDPTYTRRPKWATSFCTALVLPALERALALGWTDDEPLFARAVRAVWRCRRPQGAWSYDVDPVHALNGGEHIDRLKGSLGRTQVCNWGLRTIGEERITLDHVREGLAAFFEHHRFLAIADMRPIPHEAYYYNAGYFYLFAHYYAALAIELLPADEREAWHARLRPYLVLALDSDGSATDFLGTSTLRVAGTAYVALALQLGMDDGGGPAESAARATGADGGR